MDQRVAPPPTQWARVPTGAGSKLISDEIQASKGDFKAQLKLLDIINVEDDTRTQHKESLPSAPTVGGIGSSNTNQCITHNE